MATDWTGLDLQLIRQSYEQTIERMAVEKSVQRSLALLRESARRKGGDISTTEGKKTAPDLRSDSHGKTRNAS